jgi:hypothetical protein
MAAFYADAGKNHPALRNELPPSLIAECTAACKTFSRLARGRDGTSRSLIGAAWFRGIQARQAAINSHISSVHFIATSSLSINNLHNSYFGEVDFVEVMQSCGSGAKRLCAA